MSERRTAIKGFRYEIGLLSTNNMARTNRKRAERVEQERISERIEDFRGKERERVRETRTKPRKQTYRSSELDLLYIAIDRAK